MNAKVLNKGLSGKRIELSETGSDSGSSEGGRVQQGALGGAEMISFRGSKREVEL